MNGIDSDFTGGQLSFYINLDRSDKLFLRIILIGQ